MTEAMMNGRAASRLPRPTVNDLARFKQLPVEFLSELGLNNLPKGGIAIPYYDPTGGEILFVRERRALEGPGRFYQPKGVSLQPYGQWRLEEAHRKGFLIIVEGESDCWALWYHAFPALGLPGSNSAKSLKGEHIDSIERIYIFREPDPGGEAFVNGVTVRLRTLRVGGRVFELRLPDGVKDSSELHIRNSDRFSTMIDAAIKSSASVELSSGQSREEQTSDGAAQKGETIQKRPPPQSALLMSLALGDGNEYFHAPDGQAFATVVIGNDKNCWETLAVRGESFHKWLQYRYYQETGKSH